ncbi:hypothetical protein FQN57_003747 [Myotisia sp. PD_48]|nr:hypothetical protein FQN57_003747 [Myotisia sp. PD_48]
MTSQEDVSPVKPPPSFSPAAPLPTKSRYAERLSSSSQPLTSLSESTLAHPLPPDLQSAKSSRASSPDRRFSRSSQLLSRSSSLSRPGTQADGFDDIRALIVRAFSPVIGVYVSSDTDELARRKGFKGGFCELIRPFGERIAGKTVIRDGVGSSRSWDDFGVHFAELNEKDPTKLGDDEVPPLNLLEQVVEMHLQSSQEAANLPISTGETVPKTLVPASQLHKLLLKRLLSSTPPTPHETFRHPVACVIAISSSAPSPLESLRQLYANTSHGNQKPLPYMYPEYLRYYVLVHDEDRDDIVQSTALFDQMKRNFGLHCHLLRLRSNHCIITDDDSLPFPTCEWLSSKEDISKLKNEELSLDIEPDVPYVFESDITAITSFIRELVAQSVIPHMENRVAQWNEQVASRRRGLSGRFMSISKRWTGFGSTSKGSSPFGSNSSGSSYDPYQGFYKPESPEALLRKMADYSFMLRDFKLAASTYDLLRNDFGNDKAWKHHAGAHEMCALSTLLNPMTSPSKSKLETIDQLLETACYSYLHRCSDGLYALRTLLLGVELLKSRGGSAAENAAKSAMKILNANLLGPIGRILLYERISACFAAKLATDGTNWGNRRRKAGMWSVLAAEAWLGAGKPMLASSCLEEADRQYGQVLEDGVFLFTDVQRFVDDLKHAVKVECLGSHGMLNGETEVSQLDQLDVEAVSEKMDHRKHRRTSTAVNMGPLDPISLPIHTRSHDETPPNDDFV